MIRRRVALAVLHGIGAQRRDWAEGFVRRVRRTVETRVPGVDVYPDVIWWAPVTRRYEDTLIRRYRRGLSWQWLRRLVIAYGGDVIAYQAPPRHDVPPPWTYRAVHGRIDRRLRALQDLLGAAAAAPVSLVVVAHSLGSVIFSDFVYDLQAAAGPAAWRPNWRASRRPRYLSRHGVGHPPPADQDLRFLRPPRAPRPLARGARWRVPRAARSVGVREDDGAAVHRGPRGSHLRGDPHRRSRRDPGRARRPRRRDGLPDLCPLPAPHRAREHRVRARDAGCTAGGDPAARRGGGGPARDRWPPRAPPRRALGRRAPARGAGPGDRAEIGRA